MGKIRKRQRVFGANSFSCWRDTLEHILEKKRCFSFELDECEEKTYHKSLSPDVHHPEENGSSP